MKAIIEENAAQVEIDEIFANPHSQMLEGEFIFPIPEEAVISSFALYVGEEKVEGEVLKREKALSIKVVDDKVFYLKDGVWVDREYSEEFDEKVLVTWSDEFIDFLREHPEVGRYTSLGGEVIFIYEGVAYRIES